LFVVRGAIVCLFVVPCRSLQGRVFELCGDCNATTLDACLDTFVRVY
jgi:hypothetical protein